jgi:hypothetical protein
MVAEEMLLIKSVRAHRRIRSVGPGPSLLADTMVRRQQEQEQEQEHQPLNRFEYILLGLIKKWLPEIPTMPVS